ncbi:hypothetical protein [Mycobacterium palustre]|uniref:Low molecular weight antigen MTB12-like C-terminal domain-containing protein n=1 Tax=Mycobacterium palustre TaxID=153971 RepID=A0A1X1Z9I2_9MYCO|nr:hypothetical protein AWC19_15825 [Mycobacterium palustre]
MRKQGRNLTVRITSLVTGVAVLGAIGAATFGASSVASVANGEVPVRLAAVGAPLPADPAPAPAVNVPSADQLTGLLNSLADPSVPFANKSNLVEGGISGMEAHIADRKLSKAAKNGDLPLAFNVTNIQPGGPGAATADVAVSGPKILSPVTQNVKFVNQGSGVLSRASAMELLQAAGQ